MHNTGIIKKWRTLDNRCKPGAGGRALAIGLVARGRHDLSTERAVATSFQHEKKTVNGSRNTWPCITNQTEARQRSEDKPCSRPGRTHAAPASCSVRDDLVHVLCQEQREFSALQGNRLSKKTSWRIEVWASHGPGLRGPRDQGSSNQHGTVFLPAQFNGKLFPQ